MENIARSEQITLPINYYWNITDPALPFSSSAIGNPFIFPPSNATRLAIPDVIPQGTHPCWNVDAQEWELRTDYRRVRLWDKATGEEIFSSTIDCPANAIDIEPMSRNAVWDETEQTWVVDQARENEDIIAERTKRKTAEIAVASDQIDQIQEVVDILDPGEDLTTYSALLKEWKQYRAKLNLLKPTDLTAVFPVKPKLLGD